MTDEAQVEATVRTTVDRGSLDLAFSNDGIMILIADAADEAAGRFDAVTAVNLRGVCPPATYDNGAPHCSSS